MKIGTCKVLADHVQRMQRCETSGAQQSSIGLKHEDITTRLKVDSCQIRGWHDWAKCPYMHPSENAARRDPVAYDYTAQPCVLFNSGICLYGDSCPMSHGAIETQLHPSFFQTRRCQNRSCTGAVAGCCFAHSIAEMNVGCSVTSQPQDATCAMAAQLQDAHAKYGRGEDLANNACVPYSMKFAVMTAKAAELTRQQRPQSLVDQCGGRAAAHPPPGGYSKKRHALQISYSSGEKRNFMNLDDGMEYFKEAVAVERALAAVPLPRVSKDLERGLCECSPGFAAARAIDMGDTAQPHTAEMLLSLTTEQTFGREILGPRSGHLDMLAGCLQFRLQNEAAVLIGGYAAVPMLNGSNGGRISAVWNHSAEEETVAAAYPQNECQWEAALEQFLQSVKTAEAIQSMQYTWGARPLQFAC